MTMIVQDSTGTTANANSYMSVSDFRAYHTTHGNSLGTYTDGQVEVALINATRYLDNRFVFKGRRMGSREQSTEWPRSNCYDKDRQYVSGIPREVLGAVAEYGLRSLASALLPDPSYSTTGGQILERKKKVGPIEDAVKYADGSLYTLPRYPVADRLLVSAGLTLSGGDVRRA